MKRVKHFVRDGLIFLISISGISFIYRQQMRKKGPLVRVLCFHDVADPVWFEEIMQLLSANYNLITPEQFHAKDFAKDKINILLTFDDGYQSWIDVCLPILKKYNAKGLFFINSGLLDVAEDSEKSASYMQQRLLITPKKPLTWSGAQLLLDAGHALGGHTVTHERLSQLQDSEAFREVSDDKQAIEARLNIQLQDFAYPFGTKQDYSEKTIQIVSKAGYTTQYSAVSGFYSSLEGEVALRTLIEKNQSSNQLRQWANGSYDVFRVSQL